MRRCPTCGSEFADDALYCQWDGAPLGSEGTEVDPYVGQVLGGQIEILAPIGQGGMGTVYRAVQRGFDRVVAVKILHSDLARSPEVLARFHREAKIASRLQHPNIVHVYLFGDLPDGNLFLAMEFLDGRSLLDVLRQDGAIEVGRALHIAQQICAALGEAHEAGIIHRDLKPENIMLVRRGSDTDFVKILDFGIAKFVAAEAHGDVHTQQGLVFGTARYISPEGASGDPVDARSDVYSLGVVLYQMLCGEVPFHSENPISLLLMHINDAPLPLRKKARGAGVPPAIEQVVMRALEKRPADRYDNAREFGQALVDAANRSSLILPARASSSPRRSEGASAGARPARVLPPAETMPEPAELPAMIRTLEGPAVSAEERREPAFVATRELAARPVPVMPATRLQAAFNPEELEARAQSIQAASTHAGALAAVRPSLPEPRVSAAPVEPPLDSLSMEAVRLPSSRAPLVIAVVIVLLLGAAAAAVAYVKTRAATPGTNGGQLVAAAESALSAGHLTGAGGDGAVEILERAMATAPTEPAVVDLRNRVLARLESDAEQARREGRLSEARDSLRLLLRVDPSHGRAQSSLQGIESALAQSSGPTSGGPSPSLQPVSGPAASAEPPRAVVSAAETAFVGRPVHLTARLAGVAPGAAFTEPHFRVVRRVQGEQPTDIPATTAGDAGTFVAQFAFPKQGTWDVTFVVTTGAGASVEGTFALAVHVPSPGGAFTTGGGSADVDPPDGGVGTLPTTPIIDRDGGTGTVTPPIKRRRRPPPDGGSGGRWM